MMAVFLQIVSRWFRGEVLTSQAVVFRWLLLERHKLNSISSRTDCWTFGSPHQSSDISTGNTLFFLFVVLNPLWLFNLRRVGNWTIIICFILLSFLCFCALGKLTFYTSTMMLEMILVISNRWYAKSVMTVWSRIVIMSIVIDVLSKFRFVLNANSNKTLPSVFATIFYFYFKVARCTFDIFDEEVCSRYEKDL